MFLKEFIIKEAISDPALSLINEISDIIVAQFFIKEGVQISLYAKDKKDYASLIALINNLNIDEKLPSYFVCKIKNAEIKELNNNEVNNWKKYLVDVEIDSKLRIVTPWSKNKNFKSIIINPSLAFGTGHHSTTKGCISILCKLKNLNFIPEKSLDIGCGSGILSLAAHKLFNIESYLYDIDERAIIETKRNFEFNNIKNFNNIFLSKDINYSIKYDLIMINISKEYIFENIEKILRNNFSYLIISGFMFKDFNDINTYVKKNNLSINMMYDFSSWISLGLSKNVKNN